MKILIICLLSVVVCVSSMNVEFKDCGSVIGKGITVDVEPCTAQPCQLKQGSNYTINLSFEPNTAVGKITAKIYGVVAGVPVPFPFDQPDACQNSGLTCPLKEGAKVKYTATLPVKSEYPAIKLFVKWELVDEDSANSGKDITCVDIPVEVVSSKTVQDVGYHKVKAVRNGMGYW